MIDFKSINFITGNQADIQIGFSKILNFYDLIGHNVLVLAEDGYDTGLFAWMSISKKKFNRDNFSETLNENLFRVEYLVIDIYNSTSWLNDKFVYKSLTKYVAILEREVRKLTQIPIIFIIKIDPNTDLDEGNKKSLINYLKLRKDESTFYQITRERDILIAGPNIGAITNREDCLVSDLFEKWKVSFTQLKLGYIRNKKLEDLFKEEEE